MPAEDRTPSSEERIRQTYIQVFNDVRNLQSQRDRDHEREKRSLRDEIANLKRSSLNANDVRKEMEGLREERNEYIQKHAELVTKHAVLVHKHENIRKQASEYKAAHSYYQAKYREIKAGMRHCQAKGTHTSTHPRIEHSSQGPPTPISEIIDISAASNDTSRPPAHHARPAAGRQGQLKLVAKNTDVTQFDVMSTDRLESDSWVVSSHHPVSSQTTEDESSSTAQIGVKLEPVQALSDSTPPQVVLEKPVPGRHPRRGKNRLDTRCSGTTDEPLLIKEEIDSPRQPRMLAYPPICHQATGDLDETSEIPTPRKRRRLERAQTIRWANGISHRMAANLSYDRAESMPHELPPAEQNGGVSDPLRISFNGVVSEESAQNENHDHDVQRAALSSIDANKQIFWPAPHATSSRKRPYRKDSDKWHFAEDRENFNGRLYKSTGKQQPNANHTRGDPPSASKAPNRVQNLSDEPVLPNTHAVRTPAAVKTTPSGAVAKKLHGQTPQSRSSGYQANASVSARQSLHSTNLNPTTPQMAPVASERPKLSSQNKGTASSTHPNTLPRARPQQYRPHPPQNRPDGPLRTLDPAHLTLADFKINPAANSNESFAYHETLRKAAEKACRPGCTDPHCCGGYWRKLAELQYNIPPLSPSKPTTSDNNTAEPSALEDHQILVNYLGGGPWAQQHARKLSGGERRDLILDARAAELAQRHGKHRQRFQRRRTPPGFWRADFPSTQEIGEEGREAEAARRELVRERWREAVQEGGVWMFRDE